MLSFRKKMVLGFILSFSLLILTACKHTNPKEITLKPTNNPEKLITLGYYTGSRDSFESLQAFSSYLDIVSVDVFGLDFDGNIVGEDEYAVAKNISTDIQFYACISNWNSDPAVNDFDPELAQSAMVKYKDEVISQLVTLALTDGYSGINIDFESIAVTGNTEQARSDFSAFIHELAVRLHENDRKLIISVAGKTFDDSQNDWSYPFDLETLGKDADYLQLMTYDQHGAWGGPGSVSGADWLQEVVSYTSSIVEPSKLLIGLPAYGYDWNLSEFETNGTYLTTSFSWKELPDLLEKPGAEVLWDEVSQSPSVTYNENGAKHVAWYENEVSLQAKKDLVPLYDLGGISVWALGKEDLRFWKALRITS